MTVGERKAAVGLRSWRRCFVLLFLSVCLSVLALPFTGFSEVLELQLRGWWKSLVQLRMVADLTSSLAEVGELVRRVDWLFWILLYLPFNFYFVTNKEELGRLRRDVDYYKEDNAVKRKFIKWQGKVNLELQEAVAELRLERRSLKTLLDSLRRQLEKKHEVQESFVKKNKSDSAIAEMAEAREDKPEEKPRPKTEEGKSTANLCGQTGGGRRREVHRKSPSERRGSGDVGPTLSPESSSEDNSVPKLKPPSRSKYTLRKELEEYTLPTSKLKRRTKEKKSEESQQLMKVTHQKSSHLPLSLQNSFSATEELVATLDLRGRAASYTEVYKKKVHMPSCGKPQEITIEVSVLAITERYHTFLLGLVDLTPD